MTARKIHQCYRDFSTIPQVIVSGDYRVWRYVMEGGVDTTGVIDIAQFQLRANESYLSFYHSNKGKKDDGYTAQVRHAHSLISLTKTKPAIYFCLNVQDMSNDGIDEVSFFDASYPHIGMIHSDYEDSGMMTLESVTTILEYAALYQRNFGGEISPFTS